MPLSSLTTAPPHRAVVAVAATSRASLRHEPPVRATARGARRLRCTSAAAAEASDVSLSRATQSGGGGSSSGGSRGSGGGGGGGDRHGDGEDSSLPPRGSSFCFVRRNPRTFAAACIAVGGAASFAYSHSEAGVARHMRKVFEEGGLCGWEKHFRKDSRPNWIHRPHLLADITELLRPGVSAQYSVIVGAAGTGKSTAVRKAVMGLKEPKGVVYFLPPTLLSGFPSALADTLGYCCPVATSEPHATWQTLEPCILKAAELYTSKHGVPPVLVLDGMDLVAKEDPAFFVKMQDFAKKSADMGTLSVMFVFSDGRALPLLQSSSAITRAGVIYEVDDISDEEAGKWLINEYAVKETDAVALVNQVAGGRFPLLTMCGVSKKSVDAISEELDTKTEEDLQQAGVSPDALLFRSLLALKRIKRNKAHEMLPKAQVQELLSLNILLAHPDRTYSFHDRHVERFMERRSQQ